MKIENEDTKEIRYWSKMILEKVESGERRYCRMKILEKKDTVE